MQRSEAELHLTVAVWLVRNCGLLSCQVIDNFGAGYYAPKTTEPHINYTACYRLVFIFQSFVFQFATIFFVFSLGWGRQALWLVSVVCRFFMRPDNVLEY